MSVGTGSLVGITADGAFGLPRGGRFHQRIVWKNVDTYFGPQKANIGRGSKFDKIALEIKKIFSQRAQLKCHVTHSISQLTDGSPKIKFVPIDDWRQLSDRLRIPEIRPQKPVYGRGYRWI
jgi:hypothetical protein